jgi:flagellar M-ring protein FliF
MKPILDGFRALGAARLVALAAVGIGMLVMLGLLALRGGGPVQQSLLYADLDLREASQISDALDRAHIAHQALGNGERMTVSATDVARARLLLAKEGLPSGGSIGYEIFDRGDAMTSSQFQQDINETRALEGELARSIRLLQGVRGARVHLVLPKRQPFSRDVQAAQASVILTMSGAARLDAQGVQAVLNLVAAAVPGLKPQGIAIIDSRGNLLARAGQPTGEDAVVQTSEELHRATEMRLSRAIEDMLEQSLGGGHVRAEAAVTMNFDRVNETAESFNPDQQVVRSTQSTTDKSTSTEADKGVSVQNNLPNADAGQAQTGSQQQKQDEVTNYEIGKTVRTLVREQPQIARISLAVMIDGVSQPDKSGKPVWTARSPEEIANIRRLVQSAIGFDEKRGDTLEVVSMRFAAADEGAAAPQAGLFGLGLEKTDILGLGQQAILAIVVLLALLFVLRPMALRLSALAPEGLQAMGDALLSGPEGVSQMLAISGSGAGAPGANGGGVGAAAMLSDDSMVNMANIEGQLRASSIRKLSEMVEKHPEASLSIMRGWMTQEQS